MKLKVTKKQPHPVSDPTSVSLLYKNHITNRIPREVLDTILEFLPALDQVCLGLTCKSLYIYFLSFIRHPNNKAAAQLWKSPRETRPVLCRDSELTEAEAKSDRVRLLRRLDDDDSRWKFCGGCWNLHRHEAWRPPRWFSALSFNNMRKKNKDRCKPYAGKIDMCPCWSIPAHGRGELKRLVTAATNRQDSEREDYHNKLLYHPALHPVERCRSKWNFVRHDCVFEGNHPFATIQISCFWSVHGPRKRLWQATWCKFEISLKEFRIAQAEGKLDPDMKTPVMCPHKSIDTARDWLRQFFKEAGSEFSTWQKSSVVRCIKFLSPCDCHKFWNRDSGLISFVINWYNIDGISGVRQNRLV